jgi:hypothetical protein
MIVSSVVMQPYSTKRGEITCGYVSKNPPCMQPITWRQVTQNGVLLEEGRPPVPHGLVARTQDKSVPLVVLCGLHTQCAVHERVCSEWSIRMKTFLMQLVICHNQDCKCQQEMPKCLYNDPYSETGSKTCKEYHLSVKPERSMFLR